MNRTKSSKHGLETWQKVLIVAFAMLILLFGSVVAFGYHIIGRVDTEKRSAVSDIDQIPDEVTDPEEIPEGYEVLDHYEIINADGIPVRYDKEITNILLIGTDKRSKKEYGRSDTMVILSIDNKHKKLKMTSLLRDLYVIIPGRASEGDRLNHAHSYGGPDLLIKTVEYNFRVRIDKYMRVDFETFEKIINKFGGVSIELTPGEAGYVSRDTGLPVGSGKQQLNGAQARSYARIRSLDSDFGRTNRQRKVIDSVIADLKTKDIKTLTGLMYDILPLVNTDYTSTELIGLILGTPKTSKYEMEMDHFPHDDNYRGVYIRGMAVLVTDLSVAASELQEFIYEN